MGCTKLPSTQQVQSAFICKVLGKSANVCTLFCPTRARGFTGNTRDRHMHVMHLCRFYEAYQISVSLSGAPVGDPLVHVTHRSDADSEADPGAGLHQVDCSTVPSLIPDG